MQTLFKLHFWNPDNIPLLLECLIPFGWLARTWHGCFTSRMEHSGVTFYQNCGGRKAFNEHIYISTHCLCSTVLYCTVHPVQFEKKNSETQQVMIQTSLLIDFPASLEDWKDWWDSIKQCHGLLAVSNQQLNNLLLGKKLEIQRNVFGRDSQPCSQRNLFQLFIWSVILSQNLFAVC